MFKQLSHGGIVSKLPTQAWNKENISPHVPLKTALSKRENQSTNDAFWLVDSRDAHRLDTDEIPTKNTTFFYSFPKQQNSAIKVVTYRKMPVTKNVMKLGYKVNI